MIKKQEEVREDNADRKLFILKSSTLPFYVKGRISQKSRRGLNKWGKHKLTDGTSLTCVMGLSGMCVCTGYRSFFGMIMKNLHDRQGHKCHQ